MKKKIKKKKLVLKKWVRVSIIFILTFSILISIYLILSYFFPKLDKNPYYNYNIKRNINYKVYLKDNNFFEEEYQQEGKQYTSDLIDYIDIDLSYLFNGSSITNMNYNYDVTASIIGEYENATSGESELWTKKFTLLEKQNKELYDITDFDINQNLKINYDSYNKIVNDFKNQLNLAIDAYLNIKLSINYDGIIQSNKNKVKGKDKLEVIIPLAKTTTNIQTKYDKETTKSLTKTIDQSRNKVKLFSGLSLLTISIILIIMVRDKIFISKKTYYAKMKEKILKNYASIIVEVSNPVDLENLQIFDIKNFEDMIDVEEELKSPILLYEEQENVESHFIVVNDKYAYRFILNNNDY